MRMNQGVLLFLLTGGGSGVGRALAQALASRKEEVMIIGRKEQLLAETATFSPHIHYLCADVSTTKGRESVVVALKNIKCLKGLIHNAGTVEPISSIRTITETAFRQAMFTNLEGPLFLSQALLKQLIHGRVLHIGSGAAHFPVKGWTAYCVSKAALYMLTLCWQLECQEVAFTSVMPGIIDTDMQGLIRQANEMDEDKLAFFKRLKEKHQLLHPDTVASFLCWLLLDVDKMLYVSKEWDIYDEAHHPLWLKHPHSVPQWDEK